MVPNLTICTYTYFCLHIQMFRSFTSFPKLSQASKWLLLALVLPSKFLLSLPSLFPLSFPLAPFFLSFLSCCNFLCVYSMCGVYIFYTYREIIPCTHPTYHWPQHSNAKKKLVVAFECFEDLKLIKIYYRPWRSKTIFNVRMPRKNLSFSVQTPRSNVLRA